jgi:transposase
VFDRARRAGLIPTASTVSLDSTGLESHHVSRHFLHRSGRVKRYRRWPKLTVVCDNQTHMMGAALSAIGPRNDAPDFEPAVRDASRRLRIDLLLADSAYDAEAHHRLCREVLGMAGTIIPINDRGHPQAMPPTPYRRAMKTHFPHRQYGQRWQVESAISRLKRRLGSALTARTDASRERESILNVLVHNLLIL